MKQRLLAVIACGALLTGAAYAAKTTAFRSMIVKSTDLSTLTVNIEDDMKVGFEADTMRIKTADYTLSFARTDINGWTFSDQWNPVSFKPQPEPEPEPEPVVYDPAGDGSWEKPYNAAALRVAEETDSVWVTGWIVGTYSHSSVENALIGEGKHSSGNILLAPAPDANHYSQVIAVQLPMNPSPEIREMLNLADNPGNLGREVSIHGKMATVGGVNGLKAPCHWAWGPQGFETDPTVGAALTEADAMTVTRTPGSLTVSGIGEKAVVALYTADGKAVVTTTASGEATIDLGSLSAGVYILNINGKSVKIAVNR